MNFKNVSKGFLFVLFTLTLSSFQLSKSIQKKLNKEIKSAFDTSTYILKPFLVTEEVKKSLLVKFTDSNFYSIEDNGKLIGYAFVERAPSKTAEFDYLVLLDAALIVKKAKVLIYREEYGGEIASTRWLKQFIGKSEKDSFVYKKDISAISGATISVRSMTTSVNNLMKSVAVLHQKNIL
ncbi:FMN-binding protein [Bacteroidota bacterium]